MYVIVNVNVLCNGIMNFHMIDYFIVIDESINIANFIGFIVYDSYFNKNPNEKIIEI